MPSVRSAVRALAALAAAFVAVPALVFTVPSAQAATVAAQSTSETQGPARTGAADSHSIGISITGMSPSYATASATVVVTGTIANHSGSSVSGVTLQAQTSSAVFNTRSEMTSFASSGSYPGQLAPAGTPSVTGTIRSGQTMNWSVSFPAGQYYTQFGVFPVQVEAVTADGAHTAFAQTFLPFWPAKDTAAQPKKLQVAWIWPLVDAPQQGACSHTLATNELAASVASGGRLATLLGAGASWAGRDDLTWDIDPALLSDVSVMKQQYFTPVNAACSGRFVRPPSKAAASWLTRLQSVTAGQPAFLTPYADVDVSALSHAGLDGNIRSAYQLGKSVAGQILPNTFGTTGSGTADGSVLKAAWPADGVADAAVVTNLANDGGVSTVVLNSGEVPSASGFDDALSRTTSGVGTSVSVLLADSGITSLLGSASAKPTPSGQFAFTQEFLAETAMITSEAPNQARSLVIAPPTGWDPSPAEASALLRITHDDAPWLHPVALSSLASQAAALPSRALPASQRSRSELRPGYLSNLKKTNASVGLFTSMLFQPLAEQVSTLQEAVAATASSAWRGAGSAGGWLAYYQLTDYLSDSEHKVQIIPVNKILLAGNSGQTPVSVRNQLKFPVQVRVTASAPVDSQVRVGPLGTLFTVPAGKTYTVKMPVHASSIGTTTVQLQLVTQNGAPLTWTARPLSVEVTRVGRFLLTIIAAALGILVLTSVYRLRRKRRARAAQRGEASTAPSTTVDSGGAG
jgi:hypothetical protein